MVSWGYRDLQKLDSTLRFANVADLLIYISNGIKPISEDELFNPNDILTWKNIYAKVSVFMQDLEGKRGITGFRYEGDQDKDNIAQGVINSPTTAAQGKYFFNLFFTPITTLIEIKVTAIATLTGITLTAEAA